MDIGTAFSLSLRVGLGLGVSFIATLLTIDLLSYLLGEG